MEDIRAVLAGGTDLRGFVGCVAACCIVFFLLGRLAEWTWRRAGERLRAGAVTLLRAFGALCMVLACAWGLYPLASRHVVALVSLGTSQLSQARGINPLALWTLTGLLAVTALAFQ